MTTPALFDLPTVEPPDRLHDGPCKTCGSTRPAGYTQPLWLEPVSLECLDCNRATLDELHDAWRRGDRAAAAVAYARHYTPTPRRAK